ncbi:MAG: hypothetical protein F4137_14915 [Acidobacteria bacterium]|nr:hypothetical protein [Acidobacteriota bacterium]
MTRSSPLDMSRTSRATPRARRDLTVLSRSPRSSDARRIASAIIAAVLILPVAAVGQQSSGIAGSVTDDTGGLLPGVTVEVASPALIEGSRTVFTDG